VPDHTGQRIYELAAANGLTVQGVDLRKEELSVLYEADGVRSVPKAAALRSSDVIVSAKNLTRNRKSRFFNVGYFKKEDLARAKTVEPIRHLSSCRCLKCGEIVWCVVRRLCALVQKILRKQG